MITTIYEIYDNEVNYAIHIFISKYRIISTFYTIILYKKNLLSNEVCLKKKMEALPQLAIYCPNEVRAPSSSSQKEKDILFSKIEKWLKLFL